MKAIFLVTSALALACLAPRATAQSSSSCSSSSSSSSSSCSSSSSSSSSSNTSCLCIGSASVQPLGPGCAPSGQTVPSISSIGLPVPGGPIGVDIASPSTPNGFAVVTFGIGSTFSSIFNMPLPIDLGLFGLTGCSLYADPVWNVGLILDGNGNGTYSTPIPALAKWCERELPFQVFAIDGSNGIYTSNGVNLIMGN